MPPPDGTPQKQPWLYSLLSKIPGLKWGNESEMVRFRAFEVFAHRYCDSQVVGNGIKALGLTDRDFKLERQPDYIKVSLVREITPYERKSVEDYIADRYTRKDSGGK